MTVNITICVDMMLFNLLTQKHASNVALWSVNNMFNLFTSLNALINMIRNSKKKGVNKVVNNFELIQI